MKEVLIVSWCDRCAVTEQKVPATTSPTITLTEQDDPQTLDLCQSCADDLLGAVADLLADHGAPVERKERKPRSPRGEGPRVTCPLCPETRSGRSVLTKHVWEDHLERKRPEPPSKCPDCSFVPVQNNRAPIAVGSHRASVHKWDPLAEAVALYEQTDRDHRKQE